MSEDKFYVLPQDVLEREKEALEREKEALEKQRIQNEALEALIDEVMYWRELGKVVTQNYQDVMLGKASPETIEDLDEVVARMQSLFYTIEGTDG